MSDYESDLAELARAIGVSNEKTNRLASSFAPGCDSGDEFSESEVMNLALRLSTWRVTPRGQRLSEASKEWCRSKEQELAPGQVALFPNLVTDFHRSLLTASWVRSLETSLAAHPSLNRLGGIGYLTPVFNEERYMGPQSVVKYRFNVVLVVNSPRSMVHRQVAFLVEYRPNKQSFKMLKFSCFLRWRLEQLKERLTEMGLLEESVFDQAVLDMDSGSGVERALGLATPLKLLLSRGDLMNEQLVDLLVRDGEFQFVDPAEMAHAKEVWREEDSKIYRALRLDATPVPLVVMSTVAAVEEFDRLACSSGGALPAFTAAGLVDRTLARLGIAPEVVPPDLPTEIAFFTRPRFSPKGKSVDLPQLAAMPEPEKLGERLMPNTPILHRFTPDEARQYGPESVRVKYEFHSFLPVLLSARLHAEGVDVGLSWNQRDQHSFTHPVDLDSLREQLADPAVWMPQYFSPLRSNWQLEWWNPPEYRVLYTGYVAPGPFLDLCLALLRMAGFEFEVSVRPTGNEYHYELSVDP